jgi:hypothetical protein
LDLEIDLEWQEELALEEFSQNCMSYQSDDNIAERHGQVFGILGILVGWRDMNNFVDHAPFLVGWRDMH